jgi:hexosaminidase
VRLTGGRLSASAPATPEVCIGAPTEEQGYEISVRPNGIRVRARDRAGAFYASVTLSQMRRLYGNEPLPCCEVQDWPDYPVRGVMLDISRDKVPTLETLEGLIEDLAAVKINHLELYTEHTFAYENHRTVWRDASPMTADDMRRLDAFCRERFVELAPNQNSFGHFERWLRHPEYRPLAECPDGFERRWGGRSPCGTTLCPTDPRSIELAQELHDELLPNFTSRKFNVGCDETWELGLGRSRTECERVGKGRVYLDFLRKLHAGVERRGCTMHFWGDIVLEHPDLTPAIPENSVVLEWGYEGNHPFEAHGRLFEASGRPFYVCPGTSSWNALSGRTGNCLRNVRNATAAGLEHGAGGVLMTDWGDNGHWQYLPVSFLGFAAAAGLSWNRKAHAEDDFIGALDRYFFRDDAGVMGRLAHDLGNVYLEAGEPQSNSTILFRLLRDEGVAPPPELMAVARAVDASMASLPQARMNRPDAELICAEFTNAARMLKLACAIGLRAAPQDLAAPFAEAVAEHRRLWLTRNRRGGLKDSLAVLERRRRACCA